LSVLDEVVVVVEELELSAFLVSDFDDDSPDGLDSPEGLDSPLPERLLDRP